MPPILWLLWFMFGQNVQPCWYRGESTSFTTNERDDLPLRALDGPGIQIGVLCVGLQMLSNPHLSLSNKHGQGHSYEHAHI